MKKKRKLNSLLIKIIQEIMERAPLTQNMKKKKVKEKGKWI